MALVKRLGRWGVLCVLFGAAAIGCGGDDDESSGDKGPKWKCYDLTTYGECNCYLLPPGELYEDQTEGAKQVSTCPTYEGCTKYYDPFFEWDACYCGPSVPSDGMNPEPVSACPSG